MKYRLKSILFLLLFLPSIFYAQKDTIRVGLLNSPPFVIISNNNFSGVFVEMWQDIAQQKQMPYKFEVVENKNLIQLIDSIQTGYIDISINPLTVTSERLSRIDFTQPAYISNLTVAVAGENSSYILEILKNFISISFLKIVGFLIAVIFVFGFILWLTEKKINPEQFRKGWAGIGDGIWWSAVTMTTVGYGDKTPKSKIGRLISIIWMFMAVVLISSFTAGVASSLTVKSLDKPISTLHDLKQFSVGTISGSSSAELLRKNGIAFYGYQSLDSLLIDLSQNKVEAVIYDKPLLQFEIYNLNMQDKLTILPHNFAVQYYSFAMSYNKNSSLEDINKLIIDYIEGEHWTTLLKKYSLE